MAAPDWVAEHARKRALRDAQVPAGKVPKEPFWTFTEDMNMYSEDCPEMARQMCKGVFTEASYKALTEAYPGDISLAAKLTEHAAQVRFTVSLVPISPLLFT